MEESVALDSSKQKQFVKSVRGIKKLLKKKSKDVKKTVSTKKLVPVKKIKPEPANEKKKQGKERKTEKKAFKKKVKKHRKRGLVYLSHIPHGFYEHQMTEYFKQFGVVTNVRVIRSKRTGNAKGYAFVEFKNTSVAEIVAETMNNYLMGKRLLKAVYIPPEKQRLNVMRKNWNLQNNPASEQRLKMKKALNVGKSDQEELIISKKLISKLTKTKEKLRALGIDYDFFVPVDVPETLKENLEKSVDEVKDVVPNTEVESKKKIKAEGKVIKHEQEVIKKELSEAKNNIVDVKKDNKNKKQKQKKKNTDPKTIENLQLDSKNLIKNNNIIQDKKQSHIPQKLKKTDTKVPENFIRINETDDDSDNSDNSVDFDSDEFEKTIEDDDEDLSSTEESDVLKDEEVQILEDIKERVKPNVSNKEKNILKTTIKNKQGIEKSKYIAKKRKQTINAPVMPKKAKFEKHNKKTLNKVIKKRK